MWCLRLNYRPVRGPSQSDRNYSRREATSLPNWCMLHPHALFYSDSVLSTLAVNFYRDFPLSTWLLFNVFGLP
jgi:hypothetical protein